MVMGYVAILQKEVTELENERDSLRKERDALLKVYEACHIFIRSCNRMGFAGVEIDNANNAIHEYEKEFGGKG